MMKVFYSEKSPIDSLRYVNKIKSMEYPIVKSPLNEENVLKQSEIELEKMKNYNRYLKYKTFIDKRKLKAKTNFIHTYKKVFNKKNDKPNKNGNTLN